MEEIKKIELETPVELLGLPAKLLTRLQLFRVGTFADLMQINPADWDNVTPKVVNALKRYQSSNRAMYNRLNNGGVPDTPLPATIGGEMATDLCTAFDERRFFVANNILNAYAAAGKLTQRGRKKLSDVMQEIVSAADAFMDAFEEN